MPSTSTTSAQLKVLYDISNIIGHALDLSKALDEILRILSESLAMQRATVTLIDESNRLSIRASHGLTEEERDRGVYRLDEGVTGHIFQSGEPFVVPDISREPLFLNKTGSRREVRKGQVSFVGVPVLIKGEPAGVLTVDRLFDDGVEFERDVEFLSVLAMLIGQFLSLNRQVEAREKVLRTEITSLKSKLSKTYQRFFIVGQSSPMTHVRQMIEKVAPTKATVLLLGESGTGKTLTARIIHELSDRSTFPFIKVNCAALPENLLESELFGYEKGAFTGATGSRAGRFEEAHQGTIFLDEIGELSLNIQSKLLRALQEKEFERLGSSKTTKVDVRILTATNRDLATAVREGTFREDLYYRLNVFPVLVPPLRERREDIPSLLNHFLDKMDKEYGRRLYLSPRALDALMRYDWPGNVREMENMVERLSIMVEGDTVELEDIPAQFFQTGMAGMAGQPSEGAMMPTYGEVPSPGATVPGGGMYPGSGLSHGMSHGMSHGSGMAAAQAAATSPTSLEEMEKQQVVAALERNDWIQARAAKDLGLTMRQIGYRIKKFNLEQLVSERRSALRMQRR